MDRKRRNYIDERRNVPRPEVDRRNYLKLKDRKMVDKDRGDIRKDEKTKIKIDTETQVDVKNAGDSGDVTREPEQKIEADIPTPRLYRVKQVSEKNLQRIYEKMNMEVKPLNIVMKRQLAEKYTFRRTDSKNENRSSVKMESKVEADKQDEPTKKKEPTEEQQTKRKSSNSSQDGVNEHSQTAKTTDKKPIIKTISSRSDPSKIYKAVTFVEHKKATLHLNVPKPHRSPTPVSIKARNSSSKSKLIIMTHNSKTSVKEKVTTDKKQRTKRKRVLSPELNLLKRPSPTTEIARWAPSSVDGHTKPYYEAWVNTTLAAISKGEKPSITEQENLIKSFQQVLDEVNTEMEQDYSNDERHTGKIKCTKKSRWDRVVASLLASQNV